MSETATSIASPLNPSAPLTWKAPAPVAHPCRASIDGEEEKIEALKALVDSSRIDDDLKPWLKKRISLLKSNAAQIHLVDVEKPEGGFDLHISVRAKHHGRVKMVQGMATAADSV
jgi:hypothetical protein